MGAVDFSHLVKRGRITQKLAVIRASLENPHAHLQTTRDASRGVVAGRLNRYRGLMKTGLSLCGLMARGKRNARAIVMRQHDVVVPGLPSAFEGYTLLHLSDLHLDIADDITATVIEAVSALDYDLCVITGDFRAATNGPWQPAMDAFATLRPHLRSQVYAVLGNHDSLCMLDTLESMEVSVLLNEHRVIHRGDGKLALLGIDDPHYFGSHDLQAASKDVPEDAITVLLSHTPEVYQEAEALGLNLLLAGHTHGGQICLPGGVPLILNADCPRKFCRGLWQYKTLRGYTSAGTGSSVLDVRFNCPPEVVLHRLCAPGRKLQK